MTYSELFSKRCSLRPTPEGLMHEDVPTRARVGLYHMVEQFFNQEHREAFLELYHEICVALRIPRDRRSDNDYHASRKIEELINTCEWWQFYDICEVMWLTLEYPWGKRNELSEQANILLQEEQLGFEMRDGKIEKVGSGFVDAQIKEARYLLKEPEFKGADKHFEKAVKALNVRPNPDVENCVKDAVAAIESVGRILINDDKALLDNIVKDMAKDGVIPKPLDQVILKIYAYRGDQPGVAHGMVGPSQVTIDEAEFILAMSAAIIIYLIKKGTKG